MTLQEQIYSDFKIEKDQNIKSILKVIVGELQRQPNKILSDSETVKILKLLIKYETERLHRLAIFTSSVYLTVLRSYVPEQLNKKELIIWIAGNIDFSKLKNKMQAMSIISKHFGPLVDNILLKEIITNWKE
jgi:hypothetical protein